MTRKNRWLPGQDIEPGSRNDSGAYSIGRIKTPLGYVVWAACVVVWLAILDIFLFRIPNLNAPAITLLIAVNVVMLAAAAYNTVKGVKRWIWRKRNIQLTGGVYLRPWKRSADAQHR